MIKWLFIAKVNIVTSIVYLQNLQKKYKLSHAQTSECRASLRRFVLLHLAEDVVEVHGHLPPLNLVLDLLHLLRGQQRHQRLGGEPNNGTLQLINTSWPQQSRSLTQYLTFLTLSFEIVSWTLSYNLENVNYELCLAWLVFAPVINIYKYLRYIATH